MRVNSAEDIKKLKIIGGIAAEVLQYMGSMLEPGITTKELDELGRKRLIHYGAKSAPELVYNFPGATCISVNNCIAHGVPDNTKIRAGDIVNIDVSAEFNGYFADTGASFLVPPNNEEQELVCMATKKALDKALSKLVANKPLNTIGRAIESTARELGLQIIRNLGSHGIGKVLHDEPKFIPPYYDLKDKRRAQNGAVITIEPFLSTSAQLVEQSPKDEWSLIIPKGSYAAQYEHTLIVNKQGCVITTLPENIKYLD